MGSTLNLPFPYSAPFHPLGQKKKKKRKDPGRTVGAPAMPPLPRILRAQSQGRASLLWAPGTPCTWPRSLSRVISCPHVSLTGPTRMSLGCRSAESQTRDLTHSSGRWIPRSRCRQGRLLTRVSPCPTGERLLSVSLPHLSSLPSCILVLMPVRLD